LHRTVLHPAILVFDAFAAATGELAVVERSFVVACFMCSTDLVVIYVLVEDLNIIWLRKV
jgi:hypothetical protein